MNFVALDVETANPNMASICQIGLATFKNGLIEASWSTLVNPNDYFDDINVSIHGIDRQHVIGAPDFKTASNELFKRIAGQVVATHSTFDRTAIHRASLKHDVHPPECTWLSTTSVARRAWTEVAHRGYGLAHLAFRFGIEFNHHDAAEDARVAGLILLKAIADTQINLDGWLDRVRRPIDPNAITSAERAGNPEGSLHGEVLVFTGTLGIPRREAADMAAKVGCNVADGVTKETTMLVVGDQDLQALGGHEKSSKHRKAEQLIGKGKPIRILTESDFAAMVGLNF